MKLIALIIPFIFLLSCDDKADAKLKRSYSSFVFSQASESTNYSFKFGNSDTVFYQKRFPSPKENFYSLIESKELKILDSFLTVIDFSKLDTCYIQSNLQDGIAYKFYLTKDSMIRWSFIYGDEGPKSLYDFANWLKKLKERRIFHPADSSIEFGNLQHIVIPNIPLPKSGE